MGGRAPAGILLAAALLSAALPPAASLPARAQDPPPPSDGAREPAPPSAGAMAAWAGDLGSADGKAADAAWKGLLDAGPAAVPALLAALREGNEDAVARASSLLRAIGPLAEAAVPDLRAVLEDSRRQVGTSGMAARALWSLRWKPDAVHPRLRLLAAVDPLAAGLVWRATGEEEALRRLLPGQASEKAGFRRAGAMEVLEEFGQGERSGFALELALPRTGDEEGEVRARALTVLGTAGPSDGRCLAPFLAGLSDSFPPARWAAARGLCRRGPGEAGTAAALGRAFVHAEDGNSLIGGLVNAAGSPEAAREGLRAVLAGGAPADRVGAAILLAGSGPAPPGMAEALGAGLGDADSAVRLHCARTLGRMKAAAAPAGPALARALASPDPALAATASGVLGEDLAVAGAAVPELVALLSSAEGRARRSAFRLLVGLGPRPAAAIRAALPEEEILRRPEHAVLLAAAEPGLPARDRRFLDALAAALGSKDEDLRAEAARMIRGCGPAAAPALPALVGLLRSPSFRDRREAAAILVDLGEAAVPALAAAVASGDPDVALEACRALGAIRRPAAGAAPALLGAMTSKTPWVRRAAAEALVQVAPEDAGTGAALVLLLRDEAPDNRAAAARALGVLRRRDAAATLADAAAADGAVRMDACLALAKLGEAGLPHLIRLASHEHAEARMWAIRGLSSMGPAAKEAVPVLRRAMEDRESPVREAADRALRSLDPGDGVAAIPSLLLSRRVKDLFDRAGTLAREGKEAEALEIYLEATRVDPGCARAWVEVGLIHHHGKRHAEALEAYAAALRADPEEAQAFYNGGLALASLRRYEEAARYHREAARIRPGHADNLVSLGFALYHMGRYEDSIAACRDGLRLKPDDTDALLRIGLAFLQLDRPADAVEPLRDLVRLAPRFGPGYAYLGAALRRSGDPEGALPLARRAIEFLPKEVLPRATLYKALRSLGRGEEAARALEDLRAISPGEAAKAEKGE